MASVLFTPTGITRRPRSVNRAAHSRVMPTRISSVSLPTLAFPTFLRSTMTSPAVSSKAVGAMATTLPSSAAIIATNLETAESETPLMKSRWSRCTTTTPRRVRRVASLQVSLRMLTSGSMPKDRMARRKPGSTNTLASSAASWCRPADISSSAGARRSFRRFGPLQQSRFTKMARRCRASR